MNLTSAISSRSPAEGEKESRAWRRASLATFDLLLRVANSSSLALFILASAFLEIVSTAVFNSIQCFIASSWSAAARMVAEELLIWLCNIETASGSLRMLTLKWKRETERILGSVGVGMVKRMGK